MKDRSWAEQGEEVRRLNDECLKILAARIDAGQMADEDITQLSSLSTIARTWRSAELRGEGSEDEDPAKEVDDIALMRKTSAAR